MLTWSLLTTSSQINIIIIIIIITYQLKSSIATSTTNCISHIYTYISFMPEIHTHKSSNNTNQTTTTRHGWKITSPYQEYHQFGSKANKSNQSRISYLVRSIRLNKVNIFSRMRWGKMLEMRRWHHMVLTYLWLLIKMHLHIVSDIGSGGTGQWRNLLSIW